MGFPWHTTRRRRKEAWYRDSCYHVQLTLGVTHVGVSFQVTLTSQQCTSPTHRMIFFLAAFCLMCFTASGLSVRIIVGSALLIISILIFWYLTISCERYEQRWYAQVHNHLVKAWNRLPRGLAIRLPAKFNMNWTKRMPGTSSNDVEMAPISLHATESLVNDESMMWSHKTMSMSSYETALTSSHATVSLYDTASARSHMTDMDE